MSADFQPRHLTSQDIWVGGVTPETLNSVDFFGRRLLLLCCSGVGKIGRYLLAGLTGNGCGLWIALLRVVLGVWSGRTSSPLVLGPPWRSDWLAAPPPERPASLGVGEAQVCDHPGCCPLLEVIMAVICHISAPHGRGPHGAVFFGLFCVNWDSIR